MAQYKSFASKGSFSDFELNVPDTSQKILDQASQQVAGRRAAQRQVEANQNMLLQDTRAYRNVSEQIRRINFEGQSADAQAYRESLDQEFKQDIARTEVENKKREEVLTTLSAFSQTASTLTQSIVEDRLKKDRANKNYVAMVAGLNFEDLNAITRIDQKLTRSQFNQLDFIQQKISEGASSEQINALFNVYENSGSKTWFESKAVIQNTSLAYTSFVQEALNQLPEDASYEEIDQTIAATQAHFFENGFVGARPEVLEAAGVYDELRKQSAKIRSTYYTQATKASKDAIMRAQIEALNVTYFQDGLTGVHNELRTNPSASKRKLVFDWITNSLKTGNISHEDAYAFLHSVEYNFNGKPDMTLAKQFNGFAETSSLMAAIDAARSEEQSNFKLAQAETNQEVESRITNQVNELLADGRLTDEEITQLEAIEEEGTPGYQSAALKEARNMSDSVRASETVNQQWEARYEKTGVPPSLAEITELTNLNPTTKNKWINILNTYNALQPKYKELEATIRDQVKSDPRIRALGSGAAPASVGIMQMNMVREFRVLAKQLGDPDAAAAQIINKIQLVQQNPLSITPSGDYASVLNTINSDATKATLIISAVEKVVDSEEFNYKTLANALGASVVYNTFEDVRAGKKVHPAIQYAASKLNISPLEVLNNIAVATGNEQQRIKLETPWQEIVENLPPIERRLLNVYQSPERTRRAMLGITQADAPVRSTFGDTSFGDRGLRSYAPQVSSIVMEDESGQPGMDIFFENKEFPAVLPGVVKEVGEQYNPDGSGYGNYIIVESTDPATGQQVDVLYAHLAERASLPEGASVLSGMVIGTQGGTGSVRSADGTIASIDFLAPAPKGSGSMAPYEYYRQLREQIASQLRN